MLLLLMLFVSSSSSMALNEQGCSHNSGGA